MTTGASRMKSAVRAPRIGRDEEDERGGEPEGFAPVSLLELFGKDGHERCLNRGVGKQASHEVRDLKGDCECRHLRGDAEVGGCDDLTHEPGDAGERRSRREHRRRARQAAGAARFRGLFRIHDALAGHPLVQVSVLAHVAIIRRRFMANIASQRKRNARSIRERTENRFFSGAVKTHFKRLEDGGRPGRFRYCRRRAPHARLEDRQGRAEGRPSQEHRRPQEGSCRARARRRLLLGPSPLSTASARGSRHGERQRDLLGVVGAAAGPPLEVGDGACGGAKRG